MLPTRLLAQQNVVLALAILLVEEVEQKDSLRASAAEFLVVQADQSLSPDNDTNIHMAVEVGNLIPTTLLLTGLAMIAILGAAEVRGTCRYDQRSVLERRSLFALQHNPKQQPPWLHRLWQAYLLQTPGCTHLRKNLHRLNHPLTQLHIEIPLHGTFQEQLALFR